MEVGKCFDREVHLPVGSTEGWPPPFRLFCQLKSGGLSVNAPLTPLEPGELGAERLPIGTDLGPLLDCPARSMRFRIVSSNLGRPSQVAPKLDLRLFE